LEKKLTICELYFNEGLSYRQIRGRTGWSEATISRAITDAKKEKIVQIAIRPPLNHQQGVQLEDEFRDKGIRRVIVASRYGTVAQAAAGFFETEGRSSMTVVVDGGKTVRDFVLELSDRIFDALTIIPIGADPPSYETSAFEIMTLFAFKIPNARRGPLPNHKRLRLIPILESIRADARQAEFVFLGAGPWKPDYTASEFVKHLGFEPAEMRSENPDIACVCGYCAMNAVGVPVALPADLEDMMPRALDFGDLQQLAKTQGRTVALLAAGTEKCDTVRTVVMAKICNTLIIDGPLAAGLLSPR
jgi:DNA-binding transcriptional regulator LsrR (DeoR family)